MNREIWPQIKPLLDEILDVPLDERSELIARRCGDDDELRRELLSYLALEETVAPLFEEPVVDLLAGLPVEYRVGQQIGPFVLQEELARGGMGVVYKACRVEGGFDQTVAIKILKRGLDTGDFVRRFRTEQQVLARLDHPNIARLFDGGATSDGLPYLVMELVDGVRLDAFSAARRFGLAARLEVFVKLCRAVHTAHQHMIVHCDLKPSNILITADGEPKLLDFGIAKVLRDDPDSTASMAVRLGTPPYASPEQTTGGSITTGSDVYGLGGILHFLLSGLPPEPAGDVDDPRRLSRALAGRPPNERPIDPDAVRGDLEAIFTMATAHEPASRYSSAAALGDDAQRYLANEPVAARPHSWLAIAGLFIRRRQRQVTAAIAVALLLAAGLGLAIQSRLASARSVEIRGVILEMVELLDPTADESQDDAARSVIEQLIATERFTRLDDQSLLYDRLGRYLLRQGDLEWAGTLLERALELRHRDPSVSPADLAASQNNLALVRHKQGRLEEAARWYGNALDIYRARSDAERGETLDLMHNLAGLERDLGRFERAESLYREALPQRIEHFGADSPEVARTLMNYGNLLLRRQRVDEAAPLIERAAAIREQRYGPDHRRVATSWISLALLREAQGRTDESIALHRRALAIRTATAGADSTTTAQARSALGFALLGRSSPADLTEARGLLENAVGTLATALGPEAEATLVARRNLAAVLFELGVFEDAERLLRDVESHADRRLPGSRWRIADARNLLGAVLMAQGRAAEGRTWLEGTCEVVSRATGVESRYARRACEREARERPPQPPD